MSAAMKDSSAYDNLEDMETVVHSAPPHLVDLQASAGPTTSDLQSATDSVWKALNSERYDWRSVDGIAEETGLDKLAVSTILETQLGSAVVRAIDKNQPGTFLYATRDRYNKVRGPWNRVLSVIANQVK
jgi:hypothetical protein